MADGPKASFVLLPETFTCLLKASVANEPACTQPPREGVVAVADRMAHNNLGNMCSSSSPERELSNPAEALTRPAQGVEAHFDDRLLPAVRDPGKPSAIGRCGSLLHRDRETNSEESRSMGHNR